MHEYETVFILQPNLTDEEAEALTKSFEGVLSEHSATLVKSERWGKKRLAYRVKNHWEGNYVFFEYVSAPAVVTELERKLRIHEHVLKWISVRKDPRSAAEEERKAARLAKAQAAGMPGRDYDDRGGDDGR
jgi:small subunit ribosomal protein S6